MQMRHLVSLTTMFTFLLLIFTGVVLYIVPHGRIAYWSDWHWLGLSKTEWGDLHLTSGVLFCVAGVWHACLNGRAIVRYLRRRRNGATVVSPELVMSLVLTAILCVGTYLDWPPFSWIVGLGERIKDAGSEKYGEPPYGHAELSSLELVSQRMRLDLKTALKSLREANIEFEGKGDILGDIAVRNGTSSSEVYKIIMNGQTNNPAGDIPSRSGPRLGRGPGANR